MDKLVAFARAQRLEGRWIGYNPSLILQMTRPNKEQSQSEWSMEATGILCGAVEAWKQQTEQTRAIQVRLLQCIVGPNRPPLLYQNIYTTEYYQDQHGLVNLWLVLEKQDDILNNQLVIHPSSILGMLQAARSSSPKNQLFSSPPSSPPPVVVPAVPGATTMEEQKDVLVPVPLLRKSNVQLSVSSQVQGPFTDQSTRHRLMDPMYLRVETTNTTRTKSARRHFLFLRCTGHHRQHPPFSSMTDQVFAKISRVFLTIAHSRTSVPGLLTPLDFKSSRVQLAESESMLLPAKHRPPGTYLAILPPETDWEEGVLRLEGAWSFPSIAARQGLFLGDDTTTNKEKIIEQVELWIETEPREIATRLLVISLWA